MSVEVLEPDQLSLTELTREAIREHGLVLEAGASMVEHAILAGQALLKAKRHVPSGTFEQWLEHSFDGVGVTPQTLRAYMRLARHQETLRRENPRTLQAARRLLAQQSAGDSRIDPTLVRDAQRLRQDGLTYAAIGKELGVSMNTARRYANPKRASYETEYHKRRTHAARRALRRAERDAAAKKVGGDLSHAYSYLRKALEALDCASESSGNAEAKAVVHSVMNSLYNGEDQLNKAIRMALDR